MLYQLSNHTRYMASLLLTGIVAYIAYVWTNI